MEDEISKGVTKELKYEQPRLVPINPEAVASGSCYPTGSGQQCKQGSYASDQGWSCLNGFYATGGCLYGYGP